MSASGVTYDSSPPVKMGAGEHERYSRGNQHERAHPVHRSFLADPLDFGLAAQHGYRRGDGENAEGYERQEDHAPTNVLEYYAEQGQADQRPEPRSDNWNRERSPAFVGSKVGREYRVGVAHDQRRAEPGHCAPHHDLPEVLGQRDQRRADGGEDDPDKEDPGMAVAVAQSRAEHHERAQHHKVYDYYPGGIVYRGIKGICQRRERDRDGQTGKLCQHVRGGQGK